MTLHIESPAFAAGKRVPKEHAGDGADISPALRWKGVPEGTAELALICDDPDAPTAEPWVHWVIYGLPGDLAGLPAGVPRAGELRDPAGARQGLNSWGTIGYRGPKPPVGHGVHRYFFRLYALGRELGLAAGLDKKAVLAALAGHVLAEGELLGTYER